MRVLLVLLIALWSVPSLALIAGEELADPVLEARAREISKELRCLVCQNQSIDDSNAELARDLRVLVRRRLVAGDSDNQVIDYVVSRYGDFVLYRPRVRSWTLALWLAPFVFLVVGGLTLFRIVQRRRSLPIDQDASLANK